MTREELIAALEKAEGPSQILNDAILQHIEGWENLGGGWLRWNDGRRERFDYTFPPPLYTSSIDAALTLAPDGWALLRINLYHSPQNPGWGWGVHLCNTLHPQMGQIVGESRASMAIAICIAALKARE